MFLREFETDDAARFKVATAILEAAKAAFGSLTQAFSFTQSSAFSLNMFTHLPEEVAIRHAQNMGLDAYPGEGEPPALDPLQAFLSQMLLRPQDRVEFYRDGDGRVRQVRRASGHEAAGPLGGATDEPPGEPPEGRSAPGELPDEVPEGHEVASPPRPRQPTRKGPAPQKRRR